MRAALERRYRLVVYHYSNAHAMFKLGRPMMRPLIFDFPSDEVAAPLTTQWMDGDALLAAPIVSSKDGKTSDGSRSVYLPAGATWFEFNSTTTHEGGANITATVASLAESPLYVKAGSIVPMAPLVQYTDALPAGQPLDIHIYPGKDASFVVVEDDGETVAYQDGVIRELELRWSDASKILSWNVNGSFAGGAQSFGLIKATGFLTTGVKTTAAKEIGSQGSIAL